MHDIYVGLAIAVACTTAILLDAFWRRGPQSFVTFLPFLGLLVVGVVSMWFVAKVAKENGELRKHTEELAKKPRLL